MALSATIHQLNLQISDLDRQYYQQHRLTLAQHPSETAERLMMRIIGFCLQAHPDLSFGKGLCADDEATLAQTQLNGDIERWIDFGQLEEKRIKRACQRSEQCVIYLYNERQWQPWWQKNQSRVSKFKNLSIIALTTELDDLLQLCQRNMELNCLIDDASLTLSDDQHSVSISQQILQQSAVHQ